MPAYPWFATERAGVESIPAKIRTLQRLGVPYADGFDQQAIDHYREQAQGIANGLADSGFDVEWDSQMVAMIAYMQRLGTDIEARADEDRASVVPLRGDEKTETQTASQPDK